MVIKKGGKDSDMEKYKPYKSFFEQQYHKEFDIMSETPEAEGSMTCPRCKGSGIDPMSEDKNCVLCHGKGSITNETWDNIKNYYTRNFRNWKDEKVNPEDTI